MDLNDFLIHTNALIILLSRNLITKSHGDRVLEYIDNDNYFLIPTSNKNNLIYLLITQTTKGETKHSFYSSWVACT